MSGKTSDRSLTDMTTGSPAKHILRFATPLLIGNLFQQFYNMVDSIIVGNYVGANALAAVGACSSINFLNFALTSGLAIGIGVVVSQYYGAKNEDMVRRTIANAIYVLAAMSILVTLVGYNLCPHVLGWLRTPDSLMPDAVTYMQTTCLGIICVAAYNGVAAILRALGDSKTPLYFLIISSVINVVLDLTFVLNLGMGVFGVAFATIISQAVSAITCIIYAKGRVSYFTMTREQFLPQPVIIKESFRLGVPVALQNSMIALSCMVLQGAVNSYGEVVMAAYTIVCRVELIVQQPFSSLAMALTSYSGQNMGAGEEARIRKGFRQSTLIALIFSLCMIPIAFLFGNTIVGFFVKDAEVIKYGAQGLRIDSLFYFALAMIYVPRAVSNGCGDAGFALLNGVAEVCCRIGYSNVLTRMKGLGVWAVWLITIATWITTAIVCVARYFSGKWKKGAKQIHGEKGLSEV